MYISHIRDSRTAQHTGGFFHSLFILNNNAIRRPLGLYLGISPALWMLQCVARHIGLVVGAGEDACYPGGL